jgi:hypothetical protein
MMDSLNNFKVALLLLLYVLTILGAVFSASLRDRLYKRSLGHVQKNAKFADLFLNVSRYDY